MDTAKSLLLLAGFFWALAWVALAAGVRPKEPLGQGTGDNAIPNPSFEEVKGDLPAGWKKVVWRGKPFFGYEEGGRSGSRCVAISSTEGADAAWQVRAAVRMYSRYRLTGWIRTAGVDPGIGKGALLNLHDIQPLRTGAVTGNADWTRVELVFDTGPRESVLINCLFGGWGLSAGKAWFDDLRLELISTRELEPSVVIDARKTGAPISKYVYGQFIEHLGRCIYGGIWAEMLADRKFFFVPGGADSPWKVIGGRPAREAARDKDPSGGAASTPLTTEDGGRTAVSMAGGAEAFAGRPVCEVRLPGDGTARGIAQDGLGLLAGKEYTGRVVLACDRGAAPIAVTLSWGSGAGESETVSIGKVGKDYVKVPLRFRAGTATDHGRLAITGRGKGAFRVAAMSLMPADNVHGLRADTLALLKKLDAPIYRWPGGNFASGYDWRDGIGDPDRRPTRKNPAWKGIEPNDFGIHEFIALCREIGAEPYITVNTGLGGAKLAAAEVEYADAAHDTPMGRLRAANGDREPFRVEWWAVGNEMYGNWQLGHIPLAAYEKKHNRVAQAMRAADPGIRLVAVGSAGPWSEGMLAACADHMDLMSEHFYCGEMEGVAAHAAQIPRQVERIAGAHRRYSETIPSLAGKNIPIAVDEWNYWYGPQVYGELGVRYHLKDALGVAEGLHAFFRNSDIVFMANYAQTVNVIGCIKTTKTRAAFATTGLPLMLYRRRFGETPVSVSGAPEPLDVAAALTGDGRGLTVGIVNPTARDLDLAVAFEGASPAGRGRRWLITGPDPMAFNEPGKEPAVKIAEEEGIIVTKKLAAPRYGIALYEIPVKETSEGPER